MKNKKILLVSLFFIIAVAIVFILTTENALEAYFVHKENKVQNLSSAEINVNITELNETNNYVLKPNDEVKKCPIVSNSSDIDIYARAQVFVPIAKINYIDNNENIISPNEEIELILYEYNLGQGWEKVTDDGFFEIVQDRAGNKYKAYTYKYTENGKEKLIKAGEQINTPVFDKIRAINYLDMEKPINFKLIVKAVAVQSLDEKTPNEMWTYYINQNGSKISEVD